LGEKRLNANPKQVPHKVIFFFSKETKKKLPQGIMNFPRGRAQVPWGERHLTPGTMYFLRKKPKFPRVTHVPNLFVITNISCLFLYKLATYPWKSFKEGYNFVVGSISITTHMQKL
jgi:hypothetical protein